MNTPTQAEVLQEMKDCLKDPMWADHVELSKSVLNRWIKALALCQATAQAHTAAVPEGFVLMPRILRSLLDRLRLILQANTATIDDIHERGPDDAMEQAWQLFYDEIMPALAAAPSPNPA